MRSLLCASLVLLFATTATAQFAKNPALTKKAAEADAVKPAGTPAGIPANVDDPAVPPAAGQPAAAAAATPGGLFAALDLDGDGVISKLELQRASRSLKKLDTDNDGAISLAECGGGAAGGVAVVGNNPVIDRIMDKDKNKDGKLTPDELNENEKQMLQGADLNGDGAIDRQELAAMGNNGGANNGQGNGFANGNNGGVNGRRGGNDAMARFFQYDRNHDGRLTANEVPQQAMAMLQGGDTNGDGAIDAGELQAIAAKMGDRMKAWNAGADPKAAGVNGDPKESRKRPFRNDKNDKNQN